MDKEEKLFNSIVEEFTNRHSNVTFGKMMSSPALKYGGKVFAFFYDRQMTFKLGEDFDPASAGIKKVKLLNPFKTKGPLKGWYVIGFDQNKKWRELTRLALDKMISIT